MQLLWAKAAKAAGDSVSESENTLALTSGLHVLCMLVCQQLANSPGSINAERTDA